MAVLEELVLAVLAVPLQVLAEAAAHTTSLAMAAQAVQAQLAAEAAAAEEPELGIHLA
jgi:hypothetical protein